MTRVTQASAAASSLAFSTPQSGDLIVVGAYNNASTTIPTLVAGYTTPTGGTTSGNTNAMRVGYKVSNGTETGSGTWTSATDVAVIIFRSIGSPSLGACVATNGTGVTIIYSALALNVPDGNSWVVGFGGNRTTASAAAPSGMTLETNVTRLVASDSEAGKRTWPSTNVAGNTSTGWASVVFEVVAAAPVYAIPALVQIAHGSNTLGWTTGTSTYHLRLPEPAQAGNAIVVAWQLDNSDAPTATIADDGGNVYRKLAVAPINTQQVGVAVAVNVVAGTRDVTVAHTFSTSNSGPYKSVLVAEFTNVYAVDSFASGSSSPVVTTLDGGALTFTASGDYVFQFVTQVNTTLSFTAGGSGQPAQIAWAMLGADNTHDHPTLSQGGVYNATAGFTPRMTAGTATDYESVSVALLGGARGSDGPAVMRPIRIFHQSYFATAQGGPGYTDPRSLVKFPCSGNLLIAVCTFGTNGSVVGITDNKSNTWTKAGNTNATDAVHTANIFYVQNPTVGDDVSLTIDFANNTGDGTVLLYDVINAATSGVYDANGSTSGDIGTPQGGATGVTSRAGATVTPTTSGGLIFYTQQQEYNTTSNATGVTGIVCDSSYDDQFLTDNTILDGPENLDQNGGWAHVLNTSTSAKTVTWQFLANRSLGRYLSYGAAFKAGTITAPPAALNIIVREPTLISGVIN